MTVDLCQLGVFCHTSCYSRGRDGKLEKRERRTRLCSGGSAEKAYHVQCRERPTDQGPTVQKHPPSTRGQFIICYKLCLFMLHYLLENTILIDQVTIKQRFSIPVLAPPPLCIFRMLLLSLQMFVLFERKCPAWTSPWFQFEANVYIPFKVHISVQDVN